MVFRPELPSLVQIQNPFTAPDPAAFPRRGPLVGTMPFYEQEQSNHAPPSAKLSRGTADMREHAEHLSDNGLGNRMVGDRRDLVGAS